MSTAPHKITSTDFALLCKRFELWSEFNRLKDSIRLETGVPHRKAYWAARDQMYPKLNALMAAETEALKLDPDPEVAKRHREAKRKVQIDKTASDKIAAKRLMSMEEARQELLNAGIGRSAGVRKMIDWVADNILRSLDAIDADTVPCQAAVGMLVTAQKDHQGFWQNIWAKAMPKAVDGGSDGADAGAEERRMEDLIARVKQATKEEASDS